MFKRAVFSTLLFLFVKSSMLFGAQALSEPFIVADNVLGWPNLTRLPDGSILMTGFDKPSHGQVEGDVSCWISVDEGTSWQFQGKLTEHEPDTNRMNHAVGLTKAGHLVALVSGWSNVQQEGAPKRSVFRDKILSFWICFSKDGGKTWTTMKDNSITDPYGRELIPFGNIILSDDGSLATVAYSTTYWDKTGPDGNLHDLAFMLVSKDDGQTWRVQSKLSDNGQNETALLKIADGRWLAASRADGLILYSSDDDGQTWKDKKAVTAAGQVPGHLLRLRDGRIMLTYGDRRADNYGIGARISSDEGKTWNEPTAIISLPKSDLGYPASVELADGRILTVFYSSNPPEALKAKKAGGYAVYGLIWHAPMVAGTR